MRMLRTAAVSILAICFAQAALGQSYPNKPTRMIVPWNPGGTSDTIARILAQKMAETWGQQVVVDTRVGASGVRAAPADKWIIVSNYRKIEELWPQHNIGGAV